MAKREPFPLQWPDGFARTPPKKRARSRFGVRGQVSFSSARNELLIELSRLGAVNAVITSELPVRRDGLPYAATGREEDPGIAVWFMLADERGNLQERVFACDRWLTFAENMLAVAKSIYAMRGLDRWGMADVVHRMVGGFTALPAGGGTSETEFVPPPRKRPWREVLGGTWPELDAGELLLIAKGRHRKLIQEHHPDRGGDGAVAAELNTALAEAEQELAG